MATNERTNAIKQTATLKGDTQMNTNRETSATRESKMQITASKLIRWSGVAAILAGSFSQHISRSSHLKWFRPSTPAPGQSSPP